MRMDVLMEGVFKKTMLKRVRIKVDPTQIEHSNMALSPSYEGYVLEECGEMLKVYVLDLPSDFNPIQNVNKKFATTVQSAPNNRFSQIKGKLLEGVKRLGIAEDSPQFGQLSNTDSLDSFEQLLRQAGFNDMKLLELYKNIVTNESI